VKFRRESVSQGMTPIVFCFLFTMATSLGTVAQPASQSGPPAKVLVKRHRSEVEVEVGRTGEFEERC
jgi:hypothetical protein